MYIITWSYGHKCTVSGILPDRFTDREAAQEVCDYENRVYNAIKHTVEKELEG